MPRYYFHLRRDGILETDPDGVECASAGIARKEALAAAREMVSREALTGSETFDSVFEIVDEGGRTVARVPFSLAIGS